MNYNDFIDSVYNWAEKKKKYDKSKNKVLGISPKYYFLVFVTAFIILYSLK
jgi:hypothetical protein